MPRQYSEIELRESARAISSALRKSEKAILKLKEGSPQYRLTAESIRAYQITLALIERERGMQNSLSFSEEECARAQTAFSSMISRVEKALPKFAAGTPQHTLAVRRIRAFEIAKMLIDQAKDKTKV